jgi:hypothetical protein
VFSKLRLFCKRKSSLIALLLVMALAIPGAAQAAMGACWHSEQVKTATKDQPSTEDCHESADMADVGSQDSDQSSKNKAPCCGAGMSCAPAAVALPGNANNVQIYAARAVHLTVPAATYISHISVPDYPPPRA